MSWLNGEPHSYPDYLGGKRKYKKRTRRGGNKLMNYLTDPTSILKGGKSKKYRKSRKH